MIWHYITVKESKAFLSFLFLKLTLVLPQVMQFITVVWFHTFPFFPLTWYVAHFDYFQVYRRFCFFDLWCFCTCCCIAFSVSAVWNYSMLNTKLNPNVIYHLTSLQPGKVHCLGVSNLWERICFDIGSPLFRVLLQMSHWNTKMYKKLVFGQMCHTERKGCRKVISWPKISPFLIPFFRPSFFLLD